MDLCQEFFLADGARSDEEDAVLQSEAAARIEVVMPAVEAGLQRGTLIKQHAESFGNWKSEIIRSTSCSKKDDQFRTGPWGSTVGRPNV